MWALQHIHPSRGVNISSVGLGENPIVGDMMFNTLLGYTLNDFGTILRNRP